MPRRCRRPCTRRWAASGSGNGSGCDTRIRTRHGRRAAFVLLRRYQRCTWPIRGLATAHVMRGRLRGRAASWLCCAGRAGASCCCRGNNGIGRPSGLVGRRRRHWAKGRWDARIAVAYGAHTRPTKLRSERGVHRAAAVNVGQLRSTCHLPLLPFAGPLGSYIGCQLASRLTALLGCGDADAGAAPCMRLRCRHGQVGRRQATGACMPMPDAGGIEPASCPRQSFRTNRSPGSCPRRKPSCMPPRLHPRNRTAGEAHHGACCSRDAPFYKHGAAAVQAGGRR
jgi:hypothetical protein